MKTVNIGFIVLLSFVLLLSCGRKAQKGMDKEAQLPYEVSADRPVLNGDIKIRSFYEAVEHYPPKKNQVPIQIQRIADKEIHKIHTDKNISKLQRKINSELIYFHLLELYLIPVYLNTGDATVEEEILNCLVHLHDIKSVSELHLQTRSLHAISQGGFKYPGLEEYLLNTIDRQLSTSQQQHLKEAKQLIESLQDHKLN